MSKNWDKFGIMQGRLLPKYNNRYQAHPKGYWKEEFPIASDLGLDSIEFIFDYNDAEQNPLISEGGLENIIEEENSTGVKVRSICADYFMQAPIHSDNNSIVDKSLDTLDLLIKKAAILKVKDIVIPCVDQSSLKSTNEINNFINNIKLIINTAEKYRVNISLETDLAPKPFTNLIEKINSNFVTVNYDIGNSAALGYDPEEEFNCYGSKITDLHIKDRLLKGRSVPLGEGNANFKKVFEILLKQDYEGILIFQAYRDDDGIEVFKKQYSWLLNLINS